MSTSDEPWFRCDEPTGHDAGGAMETCGTVGRMEHLPHDEHGVSRCPSCGSSAIAENLPEPADCEEPVAPKTSATPATPLPPSFYDRARSVPMPDTGALAAPSMASATPDESGADQLAPRAAAVREAPADICPIHGPVPRSEVATFPDHGYEMHVPCGAWVGRIAVREAGMAGKAAGATETCATCGKPAGPDYDLAMEIGEQCKEEHATIAREHAFAPGTTTGARQAWLRESIARTIEGRPLEPFANPTPASAEGAAGGVQTTKCEKCGDKATQWDYDQLIAVCARHVDQPEFTVLLEASAEGAEVLDWMRSLSSENGVMREIIGRHVAAVEKMARDLATLKSAHERLLDAFNALRAKLAAAEQGADERVRQARREQTQEGAVLDAIRDVLNGLQPNDFMQSFPIVRKVAEMCAAYDALRIATAQAKAGAGVAEAARLHEITRDALVWAANILPLTKKFAPARMRLNLVIGPRPHAPTLTDAAIEEALQIHRGALPGGA